MASASLLLEYAYISIANISMLLMFGAIIEGIDGESILRYLVNSILLWPVVWAAVLYHKNDSVKQLGDEMISSLRGSTRDRTTQELPDCNQKQTTTQKTARDV